MNTRLPSIIFASCITFQASTLIADDLFKDTNWTALSNQASESIIQSHRIAVNGQVYGELFIAQDLLLHIAREFNIDKSQWNNLKQELQNFSSLPIKEPEKHEVEKSWQKEILKQLHPNDLGEIEKFLRTPAGKRFTEAVFRANGIVENNLLENNLAPLANIQREFTDNVSAILDRCKCKKRQLSGAD